MAEVLTENLEAISLDDITARHRREKKDLQAKVQALKKNAPKSKRKETMEEITRLESELEQRHVQELKSATTKSATNPVNDNNGTSEHTNNGENDNGDVNTASEKTADTPRVTKAQKRREKKARENKEREEAQRANLEDSRYSNKNIEAGLFDAQLKNLKLSLHEMPGDGDCMFNAIRHQVAQRGLGSYSVQQLREEAANYIRANKATLHCYMTHPDSGELLTDEQFEEYCIAVSCSPTWGGEVELKALSTVLQVPIEVLQAEGPSTIHGAEFIGPNLVITYHRHLLSLGEHYNSTRPLEENEEDLNEN